MILITNEIESAVEKLLAEKPNNLSFARACRRAVRMLDRSPFYSFDGSTLWIESDTSGIEYRGVTGKNCICESWLNNHGFCKHRSAFLILKTMSETEPTFEERVVDLAVRIGRTQEKADTLSDELTKGIQILDELSTYCPKCGCKKDACGHSASLSDLNDTPYISGGYTKATKTQSMAGVRY